MYKLGAATLAVMGICSFASAGAPPNDTCGSAILIDADSSTVGTNVGASSEAEAPPAGICELYSDPEMQSTVWYTVDVPSAGRLTLSTCSTATFDTRLFVFANCDITSLIACNDDGTGCSGFTSHLDVDFDDPATVFIALGGYGGAQGDFTMTSTFIGDTSPPDNDLCENAIAMDLDSVVSGTNAFATDTPGTPASDVCDLFSDCCINSSVWYSIEVLAESTIDISTCSSATFDTRLFVLTDCADIGSMVACNDDSSGCAGNTSRILMEGVAPGTYYIAVAGYNGAQGEFDLYVTGEVAPPDNDLCEDAIAMSIGSSVVGSNVYATDTPGTPASDVCSLFSDCCIKSSVWYSIEVLEDSFLDISTCNSATFDTRLFVLTDCSDIGSMVACNDDASGCAGNTSRIRMEAAPGIYYIAVAGYNGAQGDYELSVNTFTCEDVEGVFDFNGNFDPTVGNATLRSINDDDTWFSFGTDSIGGVDTGVLVMDAGHDEFQALALEYDACPNPISAEYLNSFSILMDVKLNLDAWTALWNANDGDPYNYNDAEVFVTPEGGFWASGPGTLTSGTLMADTWYRIGMVEDLDTGLLSIYVDGAWVAEGSVVTVDGSHSLWVNRMMLFGDNNGETGGGSVSSVYFADRSLSAKEMAALGGPTAGGFGGDSGDCLEDLNGDGIIDGADLTIMLGAWGTDSPLADLDESGLVDGADLTLLLGAWGDCV